MIDNKKVMNNEEIKESNESEVAGSEVKKSNNAFTLVRQKSGIAHLIMDVVDDTMNTLKAEFADQVTSVLTEIKKDPSITGVVL